MEFRMKSYFNGCSYSEQIQRRLVIFLILFPILLEAIYIKYWGVNVVFWDQWDFVPFIEKMYGNNLSLFDVFQQHNEHRLFFPRIAMLALAFLTNYNTLYEMYFSWFLAILILLLIFLMYTHHFGDSTKFLLAFVPISFLVFNFRQYDNILWGFQLQIYLCVFGFIYSIYMLDKSSHIDLNLMLAAFGGLLASYSFANGLAVWPIGLFFIFVSNKRRKLGIVWSLIGLLAIGLYFYKWVKPVSHQSSFYMIEQPIKSLTFFAVNIGSPLVSEISAAIFIGIILIVLLFISLIVLHRHNLLKENSIWLSFVLFSLTSSLLMTIGRSWAGPSAALPSRYVTITILFIIGLYVLILDICRKESMGRNSAFMLGLLVFLIIVGIANGYLTGSEAGESTHDSRTINGYLLMNYAYLSDFDFEMLYPGPNHQEIRERATFLDKYDLNVFAGSPEYSVGEIRSNEQLINIILKENPNNAFAWYAKGHSLWGQDRHEEAVKYYDEAIRLNPNIALAWYYKGLALDNCDKFSDALKCYDEVFRLAPDDVNTWINRGAILYQQGNYNDAVDAYDEAIMRDPENAAAWNGKGHALNSLGKCDEAVLAYDNAIMLDPKIAQPWNGKGYAFIKQNKNVEAVRAFDEAIRLDPKNAQAWNGKGNALFLQNKFDEAILNFSKAISLDPKYVSAWKNKASALYLSGNKVEANEALNKASELECEI